VCEYLFDRPRLEAAPPFLAWQPKKPLYHAHMLLICLPLLLSTPPQPRSDVLWLLSERDSWHPPSKRVPGEGPGQERSLQTALLQRKKGKAATHTKEASARQPWEAWQSEQKGSQLLHHNPNHISTCELKNMHEGKAVTWY
jgi:hypothetical protein